MRKLAVVLFAVGSLCLMAFPAFAEKGDMAFGVNGGLAMPMGQLGDEDYADMKMGPDFGIGFDYFITKDIGRPRHIGLRVETKDATHERLESTPLGQGFAR